MTAWREDLPFGVRMLARHPLSSSAFMVAFALSIDLGAAMSGVADATAFPAVPLSLAAAILAACLIPAVRAARTDAAAALRPEGT